MTLPSLVADYKDKVYASSAKRTYSLINQAIKTYEAEEGVVGDISGLFDVTKSSAQVLEKFSKYFQVVKICSSYTSACMKYNYNIRFSSPMYDVDGNSFGTKMALPAMITKDGAIINIVQYSSCERENSGYAYNADGTVKVDADGKPITQTWIDRYCATITFDTNGLAKPNQFGADVFLVTILQNGNIGIGWTERGGNSLKNILLNKEPLYTRY